MSSFYSFFVTEFPLLTLSSEISAAAIGCCVRVNSSWFATFSSMPTVLVTGATGRQGGHTIAALRDKYFTVYALTRDPTSAKAQDLKSDREVEVIKGDLNDRASLEAALRESGATLVFLVTDFWGSCGMKADVEIAHGKNMIDAVKNVSPETFVLFSSVGDADKVPPELHHFRSKAVIEAHLEATLAHWSVIRPVSFLDNMDDPVQGPLKRGKCAGITEPGLRCKYVATSDIGKAAANVLAAPEKYEGRRIELATCEHTGFELAKALTDASGEPCEYVIGLPRGVAWLLVPDIYHMVLWFESTGYSADLEEGRALVGLGAHNARSWFAEKGQWGNGTKFGENEPPLFGGFCGAL